MLWRLAVRGVRQRPGRAVLTLLSIVIGVAAVVAVQLTSNATRQFYQEMYQRLAGRAALEVVSEVPPFLLPEDLGAKLEQTPGVEAVVPALERFVHLRLATGRKPYQVTGIDPARDRLVHDYRVTAGQMFTAQDKGVLVEEGFARNMGLAVSDEVKFVLPHRMEVPIVGFLAPQGLAGFGGNVVFLPLELAQEYFRCPGEVSSLRLVLGKDVDANTVQQAIRPTLPAGLTIRTTAERAQLGNNPFETAERGLQFGCALMVALAIFVVLNTFLMNLGERQGQLAVLRAVGATRQQIGRLLLAESLAMGVAGAVLGSLAGVVGAFALGRAMGQPGWNTLGTMHLSLLPFVLAWVVGISVALVGTFLPIRRASRISPMAALRAASPRDPGHVSRQATVGGLLFFATAGLIVAACILGWLPIVLSIPAGVTFLAAFALVIPALLQPLGHVLSFTVRPALGVEGGLAEKQLARRRARAGLTAGVLYIAIGAGVGLGTTIINSVNDVHRWYRLAMQGDFILHSDMIPEALTPQIRQLAGVTGVEGVCDSFTKIDQDRVRIIGRDFNGEPFPLMVQDAPADQVRDHLRAGQVVLGTVLAQQLGVKVGDSITLETPKGPQSFRIAGTIVDYFFNGRVVYLQRTVLQDVFQVPNANWLLVRTQSEAREAVGRQLVALGEESGVSVSAFDRLSHDLDQIMSGIVHGLWGLLAMGFLVAGFGIGNTLMMNVLEQTREIALLRVIGMTRWQVRKIILAQALIIGIVGLGLGVIAGVNTAYIMNLCMQPLLGYSVQFAIPARMMLISFVTALLVVLLAAWIPANRAAKLDLLIALQYE